MLRSDVDNFVCGRLWGTQNGQIEHLCFVHSRSQIFEQMSIKSHETMNRTIFKNCSKQFLILIIMGAGFAESSFGPLN